MPFYCLDTAASCLPFAPEDSTGGEGTAVHGVASTRGIRIYPNSTTGTVTIEHAEAGTWNLHDLLGRETLRLSLPGGSRRATADLSALPPGLYTWLYRPASGAALSAGKLVLRR